MSALPKAINQHNPYKNLSAFFSPRSRYPQHPHGTAGDSQIAKSVLNKRALSTTQQEAGVTILTLMRCLKKGVGKMELKDNCERAHRFLLLCVSHDLLKTPLTARE